MAESVVQLAVFMKNIPGTLHEILRSLTEAGVNIEGIMVNDAADHAVVRLVVDAPTKAIHLLGERGMLVVESDIVSHDMDNRPGELMSLAGEMAKARINIAYIYGSACGPNGESRIFLHTSDDKKVIGTLGASTGGARKAKAGKASGAAGKKGSRR